MSSHQAVDGEMLQVVTALDSCPSDSVEGLARRAAGGEAGAWEQLFFSVIDRVFALAYYSLGRDRATAEDLTSDVMMAAARGLSRFDPHRGTFEAWLLGIARHLLSRHRRRGRREDARMSAARELCLAAAQSPNAADELPAREGVRDAVETALAAISPRYRWLLKRKYLDELPVAIIARSCGETPKAVESALARARRAFRESIRNVARGEPF